MLIALSLFLPYFLGLGCIILFAIPSLLNDSPQDGPGIARLLATLLMSGILLNYSLVLLLEKLVLSIVVGCVLAIAGLFQAYLVLRNTTVKLSAFPWVALGMILYVITLYTLYILFDPLSAWDARSIWFFHGKMIYYNASFNQSAGWNATAVGFSHVSYPKLVPVLAAQFATMAGFWNEYIPKASLLTLLVPALLASLSFFHSFRISFLYFIALIVMGLGWWLWNGYLDGYLALYAGLASLFFGRWAEAGEERDLFAGVASVGIILNLKNEGLFFALLVLLCSLTVRQFVVRRPPSAAVIDYRRLWLFAALSLAGVILWSWKKHLWGLATPVPMELARVPARISEGAIGIVLNTLIIQEGIATAFILFLVTLGVVKAVRLPIPSASWIPLLTSLTYAAGICFIYLGTPFDLAWHLGTSANRTMLPVVVGIFCSTFVLLQTLELNTRTIEREPQRMQPRKRRR